MSKTTRLVLPVIMHLQILMHQRGDDLSEKYLQNCFWSYVKYLQHKKKIVTRRAKTEAISYLGKKLKIAPAWLQEIWFKAVPQLKDQGLLTSKRG